MINPQINSFIVFKDTALSMYEKMNKKNLISTFNELISFVVNGTLACELGFKAIIASKRTMHTHNLKKLFKQLSSGVQTYIKEHMPSLKDKRKDSNEFYKYLEIVSNNFVDWRYYYEDNIETNWLFIYELINALACYFDL